MTTPGSTGGPLMIPKERMQRGLRMLAFSLFAGLVAAAVVYVATRKPPPEPAAGQVWVTHGEARVQAASGTALMAHAQVATEPGARALVQLPDGSRMFM